MPFFKRKPDQPNRSSRLEDLEAHVRAIRGAGANVDRFKTLEAFLAEDEWPGQKADAPIKPPPPSVAKTQAAAEGTGIDNDEAALVAELERYLSEHPDHQAPDESASA